MTEPALVAAIALTFAVAGAVKGIVGMGLPVVGMGVLSLFMAPVQAAALLVVPGLVTNVWQLFAGPSFGPLVRRLATMLLGVSVGTFLTVGFLAESSLGIANVVLGVVIAAYGLFGLLAPSFSVPSRHEPWLSPIIGLATGMVGGATGLAFLPGVPYLSALGMAKEELIQALGLFFLVSTVVLAAALATHGHFAPLNALSSALAVVPALLGMFLGTRYRSRLAPATFRRYFLIGLIALGLYTAFRAW